ncbi:DNA (cytosine-5)-methyltransferase 3A-like isoform X2 [Eriocheir sinensis]|uniref:DNA (cytosine-5)-methyltransferase 3A-like isoform X2 n=1 Tax=Eriocheir sinensis TaxID=95602 RepID=UPI0021C8C5C6|nr:DNA (cytosine-5)-methyltransferase 3A-like isoform X2 [Eriocheir sinensis]
MAVKRWSVIQKMKRFAKKRKLEQSKGESHGGRAKVKGSAESAKCTVSSGTLSKGYGRLVWGKILGSRTWPGITVHHNECGMRPLLADGVWVFWFGDNRVSQVPPSKMLPFKENFKIYYSQTNNPTFEKGVIDCIKELRHQSKLPQDESREGLMQWARAGFPGAADDEAILSGHPPSPRVEKLLSRIKKTRHKLRDHSGSSSDNFFPTSSSSSPDSDSSEADERQNWKPKASLLKSARNGECDIEELCIACSRTDCKVAGPHPIFTGGVCENCKTTHYPWCVWTQCVCGERVYVPSFKSISFSPSSLVHVIAILPSALKHHHTKIEVEDNIKAMETGGSDVCCVVCASPGKMLLCDSPECEREYCTGCVELLVAPSAVGLIERTSPWYCFLCQPFSPATHSLLKPRPEWRDKIPANCSASWVSEFEENDTPDPSTFPKRPLRVLSLFDGIGTGLVALDKLGLEVGAYYCSEIDEAARTVVSLNFGTRVTFLGGVEKLTRKELEELCPIDLLIGGSPCNDLSYVNPKRKGLFDCSGSGFLFFYFYKILRNIQCLNKDTHLFWMFENVRNMPHFMKAQISLFLEKQPAVIDAKYFSPQSRPRCFWGNIPGMYKPVPPQHECHHKLSQYINKIPERKAVVGKINCITTNPASLRMGNGEEWPVQMNDHGDVPWVTEIEKIFGLPSHYTDTGNLTLRDRQCLLGRAWSVPVICYIFKSLGEYFPCKKEVSKTAEMKSVGQTTSQETETQGMGKTLSHELKEDDALVKGANWKDDLVTLQPAGNEEEETSLVQKGSAEARKKTDINLAEIEASLQPESDGDVMA